MSNQIERSNWDTQSICLKNTPSTGHKTIMGLRAKAIENRDATSALNLVAIDTKFVQWDIEIIGAKLDGPLPLEQVVLEENRL